MRLLPRFGGLITIGVCLSPVLFGQTMVEHAATAGAAKAASSAGQSANSGLTNIFNKVSSTLSGAGEVKPTPAGVRPTPPAAKSSGYMGFPADKNPARPVRHAKAVPAATPAPKPAEPAAQAAPVAAKPEPTEEEFASIQPGQTRAEVVAKLGKPYSTITTAEDGRLVEVMSYKNLGRLRVVDGRVEAR